LPSTVTLWGSQEVSAMVEMFLVVSPSPPTAPLPLPDSVPQAARTAVPARAAAAYVMFFVVRFMAL
jgi:hypothetical protein